MTTQAKDESSWYANHVNNAVRLIGLVILAIVAGTVYKYLLADIVTGRSHFFAYILLWLFTAYIVLPRVYRALAKLYLPNYFFGRTQTGDGLLGDPINLAFNGDAEQITAVMQRAGWSKAEPVTLGSSAKIIYASIKGVRYPKAPVSSLFVFGHKQSFAFEKEINNNPRKRHHVRFWKTPENWWLPGGFKADWLAAATYDKNVGLSLFTGQVTHKIDGNVDQERDFVIDTLKRIDALGEENVVEHFTSSYHSRNGGGDIIHTDGALPFVTVKVPA
ncbi:MAG TPA: LssY C-terminal domain-containing protein [Candidatus Saccharimonadia bacterium]|nr:LssY C-terminal domain-containing protein [Candidatus Saccharimonadia bacterium]